MPSRPPRPPDPPNPIDVVEAAYDLDLDDAAWLRQIMVRIRPLLEGGLGLIGYQFDIRTPPHQWIASAVMLDFDPEMIPAILRLCDQLGRVAKAMHAVPAVLSTSHEVRQLMPASDWPPIEELFASIGGTDAAALQTVEPDGHGIVIWGTNQSDRRFDGRTKRLWMRVAAHIAAGRRLRTALRAGAGTTEAVLTPAGAVEHADGDAKSGRVRDLLREAVLRQEHARGSGRRDEPARATEAWTALVDGRWSIVDRFEHGERRYLVARRNELVLPDPRALTPREHAVVHLVALGKANKLIAYELGLAESTVATHVASAMRKLGVATRTALVELVMRFGGAP